MRKALLSLVVIGLAGCTNAGPVESEGGLAQGLTVLNAEEGALALAFRAEDVVIYMEALRGQPTPDVYQADSESPLFEVDARFTDEQGYVFYSRQGGDTWIEPQWGETLQRQVDDRPVAATNEVLFRLASEAAVTMRDEIAGQIGPDTAAALEPEISAIHAFAERAADIYVEQREVFAEARREEGMEEIPQLEGPDGDVAYGTPGPEDAYWSTGSGYYYIAIHDKYLDYYGGITNGRHSATALYRWQNSAWAHVHDSCNHGNCATSMSIKCLHQYYETNDPDEYLPSWTVSHCTTGYVWQSDSGGHNCHDDTRFQTAQFINGGAPVTSGSGKWCNGRDDDTDISVYFWGIELDQSGSPSCSSSGKHGYNFSP